VLKIACVAQIVNVISWLHTRRDALLKQPSFYVFQQVSNLARGNALDVFVKAPPVETPQYGAVPALDVSASFDPETQKTAIFLVNRSQTETVSTNIVWQSAAPRQIAGVTQLTGPDVKATNTYEHPDAVVPHPVAGVQMDGNTLSLALPPLSFTVVSA
jgi:alpha-N-arabinofuranosidase